MSTWLLDSELLPCNSFTFQCTHLSALRPGTKCKSLLWGVMPTFVTEVLCAKWAINKTKLMLY